MNHEKPYQPSAEEVGTAEDAMSKEQIMLSEYRLTTVIKEIENKILKTQNTLLEGEKIDFGRNWAGWELFVKEAHEDVRRAESAIEKYSALLKEIEELAQKAV